MVIDHVCVPFISNVLFTYFSTSKCGCKLVSCYLVFVFFSEYCKVILHLWECICLEMVNFMKSVAALGVELTVEERNLLSVAYKNVIGAKRSAWRIVSGIEQKEENKDAESPKLGFTRQYRSEVITLTLI